MRNALLVFVTAVLAAGILASAAAANHSWGGYHWARTSNPFTVQVGDNVSGPWDTALRGAASDWSADTAGNPLNATVVPGAGKGKCRSISGRVEACNGPYGNNGWLGLAQIWVTSGGHITRGTVKVNDTYFNTPKYNTAIWRASVMCQEIGHTWGLDHQDESGADFHTCMDYATNPDADNTHPNRHDYEELAIIYSHVDATTTIGRSTTHSARVLRVDRNGRSVIERRFVDGSRQVTFIIWAR
jgi:hypothetical protein